MLINLTIDCIESFTALFVLEAGSNNSIYQENNI